MLRWSTATTVPEPPSAGIGPAAATAVALGTLVVGLLLGFVLGRAFDDGGPQAVTPLTSPSTPITRPPGDTIPQASPTPQVPSDRDTTPPVTDLAPATIGTLDDPIPVGQAYILGLYEIEVVDADRDATDALSAHASSNPPPPDGDRHVVVTLRIRFTDQSGIASPGVIPFFLTDGTGEWYDFENRCGFVPDALSEQGFLEGGEETVGSRCFTVPIDAVDDLVLATEGFAGPVYFAIPG